MKKQLISDRRLREISIETAFKILTAQTPPAPPDSRPEDFIKSIVRENTIDESIRAARLAEAESFPDFEEPKKWDGTAADVNRIIDELTDPADLVSSDGGKAPSHLNDEQLAMVKETFLKTIQEKTAPTPTAVKIDELRTPPVSPPKDVFFFAHGLAEAAGWDRGAVQNWLNYLDFIGYDYMGLGMKNMIVLLPAIIETIRVTEQNNARLAPEARIAVVKRALDKKTFSAIDRATTGGNRAQRRELKSVGIQGSTRLHFDGGVNSKNLLRGARGAGKIGK